jgi:hypothetical protein
VHTGVEVSKFCSLVLPGWCRVGAGVVSVWYESPYPCISGIRRGSRKDMKSVSGYLHLPAGSISVYHCEFSEKWESKDD